MSQDTIESLRQQLAEVTNEKREYQLEAQGQIEFLDKKLAECQAQEAKLREALKRLDSVAHISCGSVTEALALPNDATALNELIAERTKTQKEYYESVFQDGANRIAELTAEVEYWKTIRTENAVYFEKREAELTAQRDVAIGILEHIRRCIPYGGFAQIHDGSATVADIDAAIANCKEPGK